MGDIFLYLDLRPYSELAAALTRPRFKWIPLQEISQINDISLTTFRKIFVNPSSKSLFQMPFHGVNRSYLSMILKVLQTEKHF